MRIGRLRHRVTVQQRASTRDAHGEPAQTWTDLYADVWAAVEPLSARELMAAGVVQGEVTHRVLLRYRSGITTKNRILFGERVFDVRGVRNLDERGHELELLCTEGESNG